MPRPGPRPYECVKRAWHSDRHQPMRGSVIQQIFRFVNETHSPATKKNKEWQEKLPIVVLKAEEIVYSKANSEAEYMNPDTLWVRVNDAVNTIIRREESTETGELLPPCVEAALNLGCVAVRASRSQRHNNPRRYLSPRANEPTSVPHRISDKPTDEGCSRSFPIQATNQINPVRTGGTVDSTFMVSESNSHVKEGAGIFAACNYSFPSNNTRNQLSTMEINTPLHLGSYPLYYGTYYQTDDSQLGSQSSENVNSSTIFLGTPISTPITEPAEMVLHDLFSCGGNEFSSNRVMQADYKDTREKPPQMECDLSLRLGLFSDPCLIGGKGLACETEDGGLSISQEWGKSRDPVQLEQKEFCFFPRKIDNDPLDSHSSRWVSEGECQNLEATFRKRKAPFGTNAEDGQFFWQP